MTDKKVILDFEEYQSLEKEIKLLRETKLCIIKIVAGETKVYFNCSSDSEIFDTIKEMIEGQIKEIENLALLKAARKCHKEMRELQESNALKIKCIEISHCRQIEYLKIKHKRDLESEKKNKFKFWRK